MPDHPELASGSSGPEVVVLQAALQRGCYFTGVPDVVFGARTKTAVETFQRDMGLDIDGIAGDDTWGALEAHGFLTPPVESSTIEPGTLILHLARDVAPQIDVDGVTVWSDSVDLTPLNQLLLGFGLVQVEPLYQIAPEDLEHLRAVTEDVPLPTDLLVLRFPFDTLIQAITGTLEGLPFVVEACPLFRYTTTQLPNDPLLGTTDLIQNQPVTGHILQWYIFRCRVDRAWEFSTGKGVVIAVIDSGFRVHPAVGVSHEDLFAAVDFNHAFSVSGGTKVNQGTPPGIDHGTCVLGIAGARGGNSAGISGVAFDADLWPLQAIRDSSGVGNGIHQCMLSVFFVPGARRRVISISIGLDLRTQAQINANAPLIDCILDADPTFRLFVSWADGLQIPVCIAAGNGGRVANANVLGTTFALSDAIVVGSTEYNATSNPKAPSSNFGGAVDVCAPGDRLITTGSRGTLEYTTFGQTSGATPQVSGTVALMLSVNPSLTIRDIRQIIRTTGPAPTTPAGQDIGNFLDAGAAVLGALNKLRADHGQAGWRWCSKCQGLHFDSGGVCPAGGPHDTAGSGDYVLIMDVVSGWAQDGWRWCSKCQGLFTVPNLGVCPAGGSHDPSSSGFYSLPLDAPPNLGQHGWRWCSKCEGLHFAAGAASVCPAGGSHDHFLSGNYQVLFN